MSYNRYKVNNSNNFKYSILERIEIQDISGSVKEMKIEFTSNLLLFDIEHHLPTDFSNPIV